MAESTGNDGSGGGWWSSWMTVAKEKTEKAFEMVSHDLSEFTSTMQSDTKKVVEKTKESLQQQSGDRQGRSTVSDKMATSFHSLMEGITKALTVEPEDKKPPRAQIPHPATGIFDRAKARLRAIQTDTGTYLNEPSGPQELYADWLKTFNLDAHKGEVSDLLVSMVEVRSLYTTLVPSEVSHQEFWGRYFYKLHQLDQDEARKQALMQRAERANTKEDSINWDEEWSGDEDSGSPEALKQKSKPLVNTKHAVPAQTEVSKPEQSKDEDLKSRLNPDMSKSTDMEKTQQDKQPAESVSQKAVGQGDNTGSDIKPENPGKTDLTEKAPDKTIPEPANDTILTSDKTEVDQDTLKTGAEEKDQDYFTDGCDEVPESDSKLPSDTDDKRKPDDCDKVEKAGEGIEDAIQKTDSKEDIVMAGESDRISPTSDSSGTKASSTDDWEKDFDVDITHEDLAAASELAQKMNSSATDYSTITGTEDDWESWE